MPAIKKEVQIGDCRLILGDCLEVMPELGEVDAVVTDMFVDAEKTKPPVQTDIFKDGEAA
jgi:hypothetical protein